MGNQESTRRVSFENDEPEQVVRVSERVVEQIKKAVGEEAKQNITLTKTVEIQSSPTPFMSNKIEMTNNNNSCSENEVIEIVESLEKYYEEELRKTNEHYEEKIKYLQEAHKRIDETYEAEYKRAIEDVDAMYGQNDQKDKQSLCSAERDGIIGCYQKNPERSLLCASEVETFFNCVYGVK